MKIIVILFLLTKLVFGLTIDTVGSRIATEQPNGRKIVRDSEGIIHLVYTDGNNIMYTQSTSPEGISFTSPTRVQRGNECQHPALAIDSNDTLHLVWDRDERGIYYRKCINGDWSSPRRISENHGGKSRFPSIAVDGNNNVHIVWEDKPLFEYYNIAYRKYNAQEERWEEVVLLNNTLRKSSMADIEVDRENNLYVVWSEDQGFPAGRYDLNIIKYNSQTNEWETIVENISQTSHWSCEPSLIADSQNVLHLTWGDAVVSNGEIVSEAILYKKCVNGEWDQEYTTVINFSDKRSFCPSLSYDQEDTLHCVWFSGTSDEADDTEVYYSQKRGDSSWTTPLNLSQSPGRNNYCPSSGKKIWPGEGVDVVWAEETDFPGEFAVIYYSTNELDISKQSLNLPSFVSSYPNPSNPGCYIPVKVKGKGQEVRCRIYNILGQLVREIEISNLQISNSIYWDGRNNAGYEVPSGMYFYEVTGESVKRTVVLR
jgi:hypothetical protein